MRLLASVLLDLAPCHQVEELFGAADLHIAFQREGVVTLHKGVKELVQVDRVAIIEALAEVVATQHFGHRELRHQRDDTRELQRAEPFGVMPKLGSFGVEDFGSLFEVGRFVRFDVLGCEQGTQLVLVAGVADQCRVIADQEDRVVAEPLELAQLPQRDGVAEGERGGGRVNSEIDAERPVEHQEAAQFALHLAAQEVIAIVHAVHEDSQLVINGGHLAGFRGWRWRGK